VRCAGDVVFFKDGGRLAWEAVTGRRQRARRRGGEPARCRDAGAPAPCCVSLATEETRLPRAGLCEVPSADGTTVVRIELKRWNRGRQPRAFRGAFERATRETRPEGLEQYFDADQVAGRLGVRNRRAADRFHPLGTSGAKKLKDFLIDRKVPASLRPGLVLLCDERRVLWVTGVQVGHAARLRANTETILRVRLRARRNALLERWEER